jgi:hypothetical protein
MKTKLLHEVSGQRVLAAIFDTGDDVLSELKALASKEKLTAASITGIGAFSDVVLRYFDWESKHYEDIPVEEQVEVASLIGDIGVGPDGKPAIHVHLVVGRSDGRAMAGHLGSAHVRPTLELIISESPEYLRRCKDPETGINLIRL